MLVTSDKGTIHLFAAQESFVPPFFSFPSSPPFFFPSSPHHPFSFPPSSQTTTEKHTQMQGLSFLQWDPFYLGWGQNGALPSFNSQLFEIFVHLGLIIQFLVCCFFISPFFFCFSLFFCVCLFQFLPIFCAFLVELSLAFLLLFPLFYHLFSLFLSLFVLHVAICMDGTFFKIAYDSRNKGECVMKIENSTHLKSTDEQFQGYYYYYYYHYYHCCYYHLLFLSLLFFAMLVLFDTSFLMFLFSRVIFFFCNFFFEET